MTTAPSRLHLLAGLLLLFASSFLLLVPVPPAHASSSTVATSTSSGATRFTFQNKVFYAAGDYWVDDSDGSNCHPYWSSDGSTWTGLSTFGAGTNGQQCSVWESGTSFAYVREVGDSNLYYRLGTLSSGGSITWGAAEQTVAGTSGALYYDPTITEDSAGKLWISVLNNSVGKCEVWTNASGSWARSLLTGVAGDCKVLAFSSSQEMALVWQQTFSSTAIDVETYSGSAWSGTIVGTSATNYYFENTGITATGSTVNLAVDPSSTCLYLSFTYGGASWSATTNALSSCSASYAAISTDGSSTLAISGIDSSGDIIAAVSYNSGSTWTSLGTIAAAETSPVYLSSSYYINSGSFQLVWTAGTSSPYNVRFATVGVSATEQVTITPANSYSSSDSATVTGCASTTVPMDGTQHSFAASPSSTCTFTVSLSGTAGYSFASNSTTATHTTTTAGGADTYSFTVYRMYYNTLEVSANAQSTFDTGMTWAFTCSHSDTSGGTCTVSSTAAATDSKKFWTDYNQAITAPASASSAPANTRWENSAGSTSTAGTPTTGGNTYNTNYYKQLTNTFTVDANAQTDFDSGMSWAVTGTYLGTGSSTICTISSTAATSDSCSGYSDYGASATIPQGASSPPANSRWYSSAACSFTQTTGGNTDNCNSYKQWSNTFKMQVAGSVAAFSTGSGSGETMTVTGYLYGSSAQTVCSVTASSGASATCSGYSDNAQSATLPQLLSGAASSTQWQNSNGAAQSSGSITSGANTYTGSYYLQDSDTFTVDANAQTDFDSGMSWAVTGTYLGTSSSTVCTISSTVATSDSCTAYSDYNQGTTIPQGASSPPANSRWYSSAACSFTQTTGGNTDNCNSYKQWSNTFKMQVAGSVAAFSTGSGSGETMTVTGYLYGSSAQTVCSVTASSGASATCSGYSDNAQSATLPQLLSGAASSTQWQNSNGAAQSSGSITSGANTYTGSYYLQDSDTFTVDANAQTDFDSGMSWAVTGTYLGTGSSTICTISSTAATSDSCSGYSDYGASATIPQGASSPPANSRWYSSAACSFTQTTGGNTDNCNSYKQWSNTFKMQVAGSVAAFSTGSGSGETMTVTGYLYGSSAQTVCSVTASSGASATCSGYSDNAQSATLPQLLSGAASSTQWQNSNGAAQSSGSITSGANTYTGSYYLQDSDTFTVDANAQTDFDSGMSWAVTGTYLGTSSSTVCTISSTVATSDSCTAYSDYNQGTTIPQGASSPPANSRWYSSAACSNTSTTGGNTYTCQSYKQWTNGFLYSNTGGGSITAPTLTCNEYGSAATLGLTTTSQSFWCDNSASASSTNPTTGSSSSERWSDNNQAFTITSGGATDAFSYFHQYAATSSYSGTVASGGAPSVKGSQFGVSGVSTLLSTTPSSVWLDSGTGYTVTKPSADFPSSTERYDTGFANGTASSATTVDPTFYHQFKVTPSGISSFSCAQFGSTSSGLSAAAFCDYGSALSSVGISTVAYGSVARASFIYQPCHDGTQLLLNVSATASSCASNGISLTTPSASLLFFLPTTGSLSKVYYNSVGVTLTPSSITGGTLYSGKGEPGVSDAWSIQYSAQPAPSGGVGGEGVPVQETSTSTTTVAGSTTTTTSLVNPQGAPIPSNEFSYVVFGLAATAVFIIIVSRKKPIEKDVDRIRRKTLGDGKLKRFRVEEDR